MASESWLHRAMAGSLSVTLLHAAGSAVHVAVVSALRHPWITSSLLQNTDRALSSHSVREASWQRSVA